VVDRAIGWGIGHSQLAQEVIDDGHCNTSSSLAIRCNLHMVILWLLCSIDHGFCYRVCGIGNKSSSFERQARQDLQVDNLVIVASVCQCSVGTLG
jgi:hypothetical protein